MTVFRNLPPNFNEVGKNLNEYSQIYDKFLLTGDFHAEESEPVLVQFLHEYKNVNIIHKTYIL